MAFDSKKIDLFPIQPGVYLMKDMKGEVLYIGKAKNIRQRVKQYFLPSRDGRVMVPFLVAKVEAIETIVVMSEKEALLLENTLIKQHQPKYNALLKDDKSYVALKINHKNPWPMVLLVRYHGKPKQDGLYFGPYTSAYSARQTLDLLHRVFPLRQCSDQEFARRVRPCILYDMKRCLAPCVQRCTKDEYLAQVDHTVRFLKGQDKEILRDLYKAMETASDNLEFEKAGALHQTIKQIERTVEEQNVDRPFGADSDALGIFRQGEEVIVMQLLFRNGKLVGSVKFNFMNIAEDDAELLETFLIQHYQGRQEGLPHEILLPFPLEAAKEIAEILSTHQKRKVTIYTPQKGEKKAFVEMAYANAEAIFNKEKDVKAIREKTLLEMKEKFHLTNYPKRIECFDNSNIAGAHLVSTMVTFIDGVKDPKHYRKYKLKTIDSSDDYGSMREVLYRRLKRAKEENDFPDLLIVDGGKGHLNVALKIFAELDIISVDVIGVAKEQGRHDKGMTNEQVFLPNVKDPLLLRKTSPVLFLIQQVRDEAHRTAITYHRNLRSKKTIRSALEDLVGIGPVKRKLLLRHFGSVKGIKEASLEDIHALPKVLKGISPRDIETLLKWREA